MRIFSNTSFSWIIYGLSSLLTTSSHAWSSVALTSSIISVSCKNKRNGFEIYDGQYILLCFKYRSGLKDKYLYLNKQISIWFWSNRLITTFIFCKIPTVFELNRWCCFGGLQAGRQNGCWSRGNGFSRGIFIFQIWILLKWELRRCLHFYFPVVEKIVVVCLGYLIDFSDWGLRFNQIWKIGC